MAEPVPEEKLDERTRAQARKQLHEQKQKERKEKAEQLKGIYQAAKEDPVLLDILEKARTFRAYHNKLAVDGVGAKQKGVDDSGAPIVEDYHLTDSEIARHLGGTSALEQLISYIEQKIA